MTEVADLERRYRCWLRRYPKSFRHEHEGEMLGMPMAGGRADHCRPEPVECLNLLRGALCVRLRPWVPRSGRSASTAVRLMYLGAAVELGVAAKPMSQNETLPMITAPSGVSPKEEP